MQQFTGQSIIKATGGCLLSGELSDERGSICADLQKLKAGQWFIALPESKTDGHDQLGEAFRRGAIGSLVVERRRYPFSPDGAVLVGVPSTLQAYYQLASAAIEQIKPKVIAVTGSSGKSTTRDMIRSIASIAFRVHSSEENHPNAKSTAKTVLSMPEDTELLVVELSQRGRGRISWLAASLNPDIAVITNIGLAHLETLGSIENIAAAKCELLESLSNESGIAILGDDNRHLVERANSVFKSERTMLYKNGEIDEVAVTPETTVFSLSDSDILFELKSHGSAYLRDAWCAIMCARQLGMSDSQIAEGLRRYEAPRGRGNKIIGRSGALIVDESYSATPDSVRAAVTAFLDKRANPRKRRYIVLSEMKELGEASDQLHSKLGKWLSGMSFDVLLTIGDVAAHVLSGVNNAKFETVKCRDALQVCELIGPDLDDSMSILADGSDSDELRFLIEMLLAFEEAPASKAAAAIVLSNLSL